MKILLVADSHGNDRILQDLYHQYEDMDYYLHAGDSQSSTMAIYPFDSVKGNCDFYDFDRCRKIYTPMGYLFMKHFPTLHNNESEDVKFFVHGHTHQVKVTKGNIVTICPGSLTRPRDGTNGTYMIMDIHKEKTTITIYDVEMKKVLNIIEIM